MNTSYFCIRQKYNPQRLCQRTCFANAHTFNKWHICTNRAHDFILFTGLMHDYALVTVRLYKHFIHSQLSVVLNELGYLSILVTLTRFVTSLAPLGHDGDTKPWCSNVWKFVDLYILQLHHLYRSLFLPVIATWRFHVLFWSCFLHTFIYCHSAETEKNIVVSVQLVKPSRKKRILWQPEDEHDISSNRALFMVVILLSV